MIVFTNYALEQLLLNITQTSGGTAGILNGANVHLYTNGIAPSPSSIVSNFAEANFTSYTPLAITWGGPYVSSTQQAEIVGNTLVWTAGAAPIPQIIYGAFVTDSTNTHLLFVDKFTVPVTIQLQDDGLSYAPVLAPNFAISTPSI